MDKLSSKQKNLIYAILILIGIVITLLKFYKPILLNIKNIKKTEQKLLLVDNANDEILDLEYQFKILNESIGCFRTTEDTQEEILNLITQNSKIKIAKIYPVHIFNKNSFSIYTHQITLESNYNELSKLLYNLEKKLKFSKLKGLNYNLKENFNKTNQLFLHLTLQNYEKK